MFYNSSDRETQHDTYEMVKNLVDCDLCHAEKMEKFDRDLSALNANLAVIADLVGQVIDKIKAITKAPAAKRKRRTPAEMRAAKEATIP